MLINYFNELREQTSDVIVTLLAIDMDYMEFCCEACIDDLMMDIEDVYGDEILPMDYVYLKNLCYSKLDE